MEAGTGGGTPQEQLQAALDRLANAVSNMQGRVNTDLSALRQQVDELNAEHDDIDLTEIMVQIDSIISVVGEIDPATVVQPPSEQPPVEQPPADTGTTTGPPSEQPPADTPPVEEPPAEQPPVGDETGDTGAVVGDQGEQADAPPLYVYDGDVSQTDTGAFTAAGVQTPDGQPLFTYQGDTPGGAPQGDGIGGSWHLYQGPTVAQ
jgi:hypothetical protein